MLSSTRLLAALQKQMLGNANANASKKGSHVENGML